MFETFIFIGSGLFAFYSYYKAQEFKSTLEREAKAYCEEEIYKIKRSHEFNLGVLKDDLHAANETIAKLRVTNKKADKLIHS